MGYTKKLELKIRRDPMNLLILLAVCEKNIVRYSLLVLTMLLGTDVPSIILLHATYIILIVQCFSQYHIKIQLKELCVFLFIVLAIVFSCLIYPDNTQYIFDSNNFWNTIFPCLRYFIVGLAFIADEDMMNLIGKASCWGIVIETLFVFLYLMPRGLMGTDDMSRSYQLLPNVLLALNYAFNQKKILRWITPIIGIGYLLAMGSRGPIIVTLVYILIKLIKTVSTKKTIKLTVLMIICIFGVIFFGSSMYIDALRMVRDIFLQLGLSTRILDLAIVGETISHTSGRDEIFTLLIQKISERPLLGYGVYGEWKYIGWSAHNLYLEIITHYGIPIGVFILLWIIKTIVGTYFLTKNTYAKDFILIWVCYIFVRGIFGGGYLEFGMSFVIGFCINEIRRVKYWYTDEKEK